jgi:hypothetical protein
LAGRLTEPPPTTSRTSGSVLLTSDDVVTSAWLIAHSALGDVIPAPGALEAALLRITLLTSDVAPAFKGSLLLGEGNPLGGIRLLMRKEPGIAVAVAARHVTDGSI